MIVRRGLVRVLYLVALACAVTSCAQTTDNNVVYVVVEPRRTGELLSLMGALSRENDMTPYFSEVAESPGVVRHMLEASGWRVALWFQNVPLSGEEDPKLCGSYAGPHSDLAQFGFFVRRRFVLGSQRNADAVRTNIAASLKSLGYDVRSEPVACGSVALHDKPET